MTLKLPPSSLLRLPSASPYRAHQPPPPPLSSPTVHQSASRHSSRSCSLHSRRAAVARCCGSPSSTYRPLLALLYSSSTTSSSSSSSTTSSKFLPRANLSLPFFLHNLYTLSTFSFAVLSSFLSISLSLSLFSNGFLVHASFSQSRALFSALYLTAARRANEAEQSQAENCDCLASFALLGHRVASFSIALHTSNRTVIGWSELSLIFPISLFSSVLVPRPVFQLVPYSCSVVQPWNTRVP